MNGYYRNYKVGTQDDKKDIQLAIYIYIYIYIYVCVITRKHTIKH